MNTLDKIFEKFGIYDLFVILLSGMIMMSISVIVVQQTDLLKTIHYDNFPDKTLLFFLGSYLLGLIIQECASILDKYILFPNNIILKMALWTESDDREKIESKYFRLLSCFLFKRIISSHIYLTKKERSGVLQKVSEEESVEIDDETSWLNDSKKVNLVYNHCKFSLLHDTDSMHIDKEQVISSLCRSFFVFFLFLAIFACVYQSHFQSVSWLYPFIPSIVFASVFFLKFIRHAKMRFVYIIRWYYYNKVEKTDSADNSQKTI